MLFSCHSVAGLDHMLEPWLAAWLPCNASSLFEGSRSRTWCTLLVLPTLQLAVSNAPSRPRK